ncbi:A24 family peptidase [Streptomyces somaliensis]|uniref:prepilin peptidase n=1 Tax=Streptomyces somaliensis TaxID=78355 RepID=UPI0020CF7F19|nr:A24 family peptidase [Streptomyces somaliensis]MCP9944779.1 A24 family peptidase [Streptomyces somaliensis]MCP9961992.1 A24 family peptidase [Streptomyces somaliensis]MCP9974814.1 A24 family peptidase [Streptomyces somaliensis]
MYVTLIAAAVLWGAAAALLVRRAAHRFAVEPEEPRRGACPAGHAYAPGPRGWLGPAHCAACPPSAAPGPRRAVGVPLAGAAGCGLLAAATGWRPELAVWLLLAPFALLLAAVDRRVHRLPDPLTLPLAAAVPLLLGAAALVPGHAGSWRLSVLGALALGGAYLVLFLLNPNGMGFGDVKLALPLGAALGWYGWPVLLAGAFAGFLLGAGYGLGLVVRRRATRGSAIPFGPFMIAGALLGLLLGALAHA